MSFAETMAAIEAKRVQIADLKREMQALRATAEPEEVQDYVLAGWDGPVKLSALFGDKRDLLMIHNMGTSCPACTMWADGFNGVYDHLAARAAFALVSPNTPEVQKRFAAKRGWRFPMVSYEGSQFGEDMGFREGGEPAELDQGGFNPGVTAFRRDGDRIFRVSNAEFGPHDDFCAVFHLFDLFPDGMADWRPKFSYA
jgi:predicted dithiol-disulfide oxidoreductase (DUF899 family)